MAAAFELAAIPFVKNNVFGTFSTATLEQMKVLETIADDTLVILQIHKRVWPASQRDALFWSHVRRVPNDTDRDAQDIWIACNHSTEHHEAPVISM